LVGFHFTHLNRKLFFMKKLYSSLSKVLLTAVLILATGAAFSQLKVGTNPTQINKSSILELESDRQGFLLTRLVDTLNINALTPPDGMLIYLQSASPAGRGLYIRKSGIWQRFLTDSSALDKWSKSGDLLNGAEKMGSLNAQKLRLITNNIERLTIDGSTGDVNISNSVVINKSLAVTDTTTTGKLVVKDSVSFNKINRSAALTEVLVIDTADGSVRRRGLSPDAFKSLVMGSFRTTTNANGLSRITGAVSDTLVLHPASATTPGGVSAITQTFGGKKTFQDSLTAAQTLLVGGTATANSTLQVQGSVSFPIRTVTASTTLTNVDYTVLVNAAGAAVNIALPTPSNSITGRIYIIKKIAGGLANDVIVNGAIEDGTSYPLYNDWTVVKVQTDGNRWYVIK
jgi:hypothetical protein